MCKCAKGKSLVVTPIQGRKDKMTQSSELRGFEITQPIHELTSYLTSRDHWLQFKPN